MGFVGKYLAEVRLRKNLSQKEVADKFGFGTIQYISNIERGVTHLSFSMIKPIAKLYDLDESYLFSMVWKEYREKFFKKAVKDAGLKMSLEYTEGLYGGELED